MARQRVASAICSSSESQFFNHTAPGANRHRLTRAR
jgi:hypothetical protein